jgi:hypothetical protein
MYMDVVVQKDRIWVMVRVMVGFFHGSEFHAGTLLSVNDLPPSVM